MIFLLMGFSSQFIWDSQLKIKSEIERSLPGWLRWTALHQGTKRRCKERPGSLLKGSQRDDVLKKCFQAQLKFLTRIVMK